MKALKHSLTLSIISILLVSLAVVTPAYADKPVFVDVPVAGEFSFPSPCGFEITVYWNATIPTKLWYDDAGQVVRSIENWSKFTSTFLANGKSLDFQIAGPVITRIAQDGSGYTVSTSGAGAAVAMLTLPGYGRVWGNAGHFTARYNAAGEFIEMTREAGSEVVMDWPPICAYLAP